MCVYKLQPTSSSTVEGEENVGVGGQQHDDNEVIVAPGCMDKFHDAPYMGCYKDNKK